MMKLNVKVWLMNWFEKNADIEAKELEKHTNDSYFEMGYIDSFEFINLIGDIEDELGVQFDNDQFEDRSFSTIEGMARIIEEAMSK